MAREEVAVAGEEAAAEGGGGGLLLEIVGSPLNLSLLGLCLFLLYQILRGERPAVPAGEADPPPLPKMKRRDFTLAQLRPYDGVQDPRILMAINGKVFDVTRARKFYGPGEGRGEPSRGSPRLFGRRGRRALGGLAGEGRCWLRGGSQRRGGLCALMADRLPACGASRPGACLAKLPAPSRPCSRSGGLERIWLSQSREG